MYVWNAPCWGQQFDPPHSSHRWSQTEIIICDEANVEQISTVQLGVWSELLPSKPDPKCWFQRRRLAKRGLPSAVANKADEVLETNRLSLLNRLQLAGYLDAEVEGVWEFGTRKATMQLNIRPGHRWMIDSITWNVQQSGLPAHRVVSASGLREGIPFEMAKLRAAQDDIAQEAQSLGFTTFHSGLVEFEADTASRDGGSTVRLTVTCVPWDVKSAPWVAGGIAGDVTTPHPRVHVGDVFWAGERPGFDDRPNGLRKEVWAQLARIQEDEVVQPSRVKQVYRRFSALPAVEEVQLNQTMRWDSTAEETEVGLPGKAVSDVFLELKMKPSHDVAFELDLIRNNVRYGPKLATTLLHRNARGWGEESAIEFAFGYVAVSPFASLNRTSVLNSGEWSLRWSKSQIGIQPLPLEWFRPSTQPKTDLDVGWDREVWPEFTRSQIHATYDAAFIENPSRASVVHLQLLDVSYVNLSNRDPEFTAWLDSQGNAFLAARFNNHLTLGSSVSWTTQWTLGEWSGAFSLRSNWAGMLAQNLAERLADPSKFDVATGAWLMAPSVPLIQYQRVLLDVRGTRISSSNHAHACHMLVGWANPGENTPSLPLEQSFFSGGANGVRGWRLRELGPGELNVQDDSGIAGIGDVRVDVQYEWRIPINDTWSSVCFSDLGNVWLHSNEQDGGSKATLTDWSSWGWSAGGGFRYDFSFFILRVEGGIRLHDPNNAEGFKWIGQSPLRGALHLGLGKPF